MGSLHEVTRDPGWGTTTPEERRLDESAGGLGGSDGEAMARYGRGSAEEQGVRGILVASEVEREGERAGRGSFSGGIAAQSRAASGLAVARERARGRPLERHVVAGRVSGLGIASHGRRLSGGGRTAAGAVGGLLGDRERHPRGFESEREVSIVPDAEDQPAGREEGERPERERGERAGESLDHA
jgi:hypothetical protein